MKKTTYQNVRDTAKEELRKFTALYIRTEEKF